jgi:hypothetical protein
MADSLNDYRHHRRAGPQKTSDEEERRKQTQVPFTPFRTAPLCEGSGMPAKEQSMFQECAITLL